MNTIEHKFAEKNGKRRKMTKLELIWHGNVGFDVYFAFYCGPNLLG